jgi:proline dehydrogenase
VAILDAPLRRLLLGLAHNRTLGSIAARHGHRLGAARFVAGSGLTDAVAAIRVLERRGLVVTVAQLGEGVMNTDAADGDAAALVTLIERLAAESATRNISLKPTHLGLDIDEHDARDRIERVVSAAARVDGFVRIDMEDAERVDATLRIYTHLRDAGYANVGCVLQSCLLRTPHDYDALRDVATNIRLVKGAYQEPHSVAYARKSDVDAAYLHLAQRLVRDGVYAAFATHDESIITTIRAVADESHAGKGRFEFQMLYGVRPRLQQDLARAGYTVRVYVPFGSDWYPYLMRRLAERPANVGFVVRNLARR